MLTPALRSLAALAVGAVLAGCSSTRTERSAGGILVLDLPAAAGTDAAETRTGEMTVGERLEVRLGASAGTGYAWTLAGPVPANMQMTGRDPAGAVTPAPMPAEPAGSPPRAGGATISTFGMNAVAQGEARMRFVLVRPWEKGADARPARTLDVSVEVKPTPKPADGSKSK